MKIGSISINIIIMLTLALVALIIFLIFYYKTISGIGQESTCSDYKGKCINIEDSCDEGYIKEPTRSCGEKKVCCTPVRVW